MLSPSGPPPRALLRRGQKRKDASWEEPAADVTAVLEEHYERQRAAKAARMEAGASAASLNGTHNTAAASLAAQMPPPIHLAQSTLSAIATSSSPSATNANVAASADVAAADTSSGATKSRSGRRSPATVAMQRAAAAAVKQAKQQRRKVIAAAAAAVVGDAMQDVAAPHDVASAAVAAAPAVAAAVPSVPVSPPQPTSLTRALPFVFHMLSSQSLLVVSRVSHLWRRVATQPLVFNSASAWTCAPADLERVATNAVLRNVKRLTLGRACDPYPLRTTIDDHLRGSLRRMTQLHVLVILHLELSSLYSLTEDLGAVGQRLRELHIHEDSSLVNTIRKREEAAAVMAAEAAAAATAEAERVAASARSAGGDAMEDVPRQPGLENLSSVMEVSHPPPAPIPLMPSLSRNSCAPNGIHATGGGIASAGGTPPSRPRRLPALYSFISFLSLLPNLQSLTWCPTQDSDFDRPNLPLKQLHTLRIRHPRLRNAHTPAFDAEAAAAATAAAAACVMDPAAAASSSCSVADLAALDAASHTTHSSEERKDLVSHAAAGLFATPVDGAPQAEESFPRDKTREQVAFLRALPSLTELDWPGWSVENMRAFCAPRQLPTPVQSPLPRNYYSYSTLFAPDATGGVSSPLQAAFQAALAAQPPLVPEPGYLLLSPPAPSPRSLPPQLQTLLLPDDVLSDAHLHALSSLRTLTHLSICLCAEELTDAGLQSLCSLELLQHLQLKGVVRKSPTPSGAGSVAVAKVDPSRLMPPSFLGSAPPVVASAAPSPMPTPGSVAPSDFGSFPTVPHAASQGAAVAAVAAAATGSGTSKESTTSGEGTGAILHVHVDAAAEVTPENESRPSLGDRAASLSSSANEEAERVAAMGASMFRQAASVVSYRSMRMTSAAAAQSAMEALAQHNAAAAAAAADAAGGSSFLSPNGHERRNHARKPSSASSAAPPPPLLARSASDPMPYAQPQLQRSSSFRELEVVRLASLCSLRTLKLDCIDLGREGLHILCHSLSQLRSLTLRRMALPTLHPVACLTKLRFLRLEQCAGVWGPGLERNLRPLRHLRHVSVLRCPGVQEDALRALADELASPKRAKPSPASPATEDHAATCCVPHIECLGCVTSPNSQVAVLSSPSSKQWPELQRIEFEPAEQQALETGQVPRQVTA